MRSLKRSIGQTGWLPRLCLIFFGLALLPALACSQQSRLLPNAPGPDFRGDSQTAATIIGTVEDANGNVLPGATATLTRSASPEVRTVAADSNGFFALSVAPGPWDVAISSPGLTPWTSSLAVQPGEYREISGIVLKVNAAYATVQVRVSQQEIAEEQLRLEENQRLLGMFPNFYVSYFPNAAPLTPRQKFTLAWKNSIDPFSVLESGISAGFAQAENDESGYGQGAAGYGKRFGSAYADDFVSIIMGGAILPTLFHQDPRYYYRGKGSVFSRVAYAVSTIFICKGDNGRWQPNYSFVVGNFASGAISNLYYPKEQRGFETTFRNGAITTFMGTTGALTQEFLMKAFTRGKPKSL
jgi:hypothetical protein